jgi:hypothetical protein
MNLIICGLKVESQQVSSDRDKVLHINYNYSYILKAGNGSFRKKLFIYPLLYSSGGATGYAGYAPAYPAGLGSYHVCIRISRKKKKKKRL